MDPATEHWHEEPPGHFDGTLVKSAATWSRLDAILLALLMLVVGLTIGWVAGAEGVFL
jgi:hypothetical protein